MSAAVHSSEPKISENRGQFSLLTESEALQAALEIAHTGAWGWDEITKTKLWPAQTKAIFGLSPNVEMTRDLFVSMLHPEDVPIYRAAWAAGMDPDGNHVYQATYRIRRADDGEVRWISSRARVTFVDRKPVRVLGAMRDITDDRMMLNRLQAAEADLRVLNDALEERVRLEIESREHAQASLARAENLAALGRLAAGVAHDFNNLLQVVMGAASMLMQRTGEASKVVHYARIIESTAERGASVTSRLLAFARQAELNPEAVELTALLAGLRDVVHHTMGGTIVLKLELPPEIPPVFADSRQLETALINLVANARDAMDGSGDICISVTLDSAELSKHNLVPGVRTRGYVRLSVSDTGKGMDDRTLAHAIEPFFTTKPIGKGTGLGLPMVRGFAEQSGGRVAIESRPGLGTTVHVWLPALGGSFPEEEAISEKGRGSGNLAGLRVLLVDDDPSVRSVLAEQLRHCRLEIVEAANASHAMDRLRESVRFDAMVTDFAMPGMNGAMFIREARLVRPHLPMILLTGYADNRAIDSLMREEHPLLRLVNKPVTGMRLADCIQRSLSV